ncbi:MAG: hypothetical protein JO044_09220 [Mycobacteriaceae bacterium]|nr:hypothetical protein [Mycobacteriaceae bacterium]
MTGPDHETRPISVAELLARNGTIGAPPVGGRRRRRRGNTDAVTVAELTGEIPAIPEVDQEAVHEADDHDAAQQGPQATVPEEQHPGQDATVAQAAGPGRSNGTAGQTEYQPEPDEHVDDSGGSSVAEQMRPDPVVEDEDDEQRHDVLLEEPPADDEDDDLAAYLRSIRTPLFGGATRVDRARDEPRVLKQDQDVDARSRAATAADVPAETTTTAELEEHEPPTRMQTVVRAGLIVLQSVVAVAFGAGLFIAFDQLWKWNNIVALVLSVLVILGLVVAVRVVRKTEDIASTLIAVAVGALVTLGPLALLQSG